ALNVQGLSALNHLNCGGNELTALNVQGLNALQHLVCSWNQLTELNVQGLNALQSLNCYNNQLTASVFKKLFDDLPVRQNSDNAMCVLYTEKTGVTEGNHKDFTSSGELKTAFDNAKTTKHWKMYKLKNGHRVEI
ncbi:MAG: leucine-rich repeat domain-containing protein, partial [Treponema lecithinolyticum]